MSRKGANGHHGPSKCRRLDSHRRDVPVGVPLDLSTPTGMSSIGTCGENCKSDNVPKYRGLLVAFLLLWHEKLMSRKLIIYYLFYFLFSEN